MKKSTLKRILLCLTIIFTALGVIQKYWIPTWESDYVFGSSAATEFVIKNCLLLIFLILALIFIVQIIIDFSDNYPKEIRKKLLDDVHTKLFQGTTDGDNYNRITYFREKFIFLFRFCRSKKFPWIVDFGFGRHLVIECRTGKFQNSNTKFKISTDHENHCEGIAGLCWHQQKKITRKLLCSEDENEDKKAEYYKKGNISKKKMKNLNIWSRSIIGVNVRDISGKRAGVIIIDSKKATLNIEENEIDQMLEKIAYIAR